MPQPHLNPKMNAVVILLWELSRAVQWNKVKVTQIHNCIQATVLTGPHPGQTVLIPTIKPAPSDANLPFALERKISNVIIFLHHPPLVALPGPLPWDLFCTC